MWTQRELPPERIAVGVPQHVCITTCVQPQANSRLWGPAAAPPTQPTGTRQAWSPLGGLVAPVHDSTDAMPLHSITCHTNLFQATPQLPVACSAHTPGQHVPARATPPQVWWHAPP